jgi:hypothetical protein
MIQRLLVIQLTSLITALKIVNKMIRLIAVWEVRNRRNPKMIQTIAMISPKKMMKPMKWEYWLTVMMQRKQSN